MLHYALAKVTPVPTFMVSFSIIIAALPILGTLYYIFKRSALPPLAEYKLIVLLVFFSLSSLMSVLFATTGQLSFEATSLIINMTGPFVLCIGGVILYEKLAGGGLPEAFERHRNITQLAESLIAQAGAAPGLTYAEWLKTIPASVQRLWRNDENDCLGRLLLGLAPPVRLPGEAVTSSVCYDLGENLTLAFRLVDAPQIFNSPGGSDGSTNWSTTVLHVDGNSVEAAREGDSETEFTRPKGANHGLFIAITFFEDSKELIGDYVLFQSTKMATEKLTFSFTLLSKRKVNSPKLWTISHDRFCPAHKVPIRLGEIPQNHTRDAVDRLARLLPHLDSFATANGDSELAEMRARIGKKLNSENLAELLQSSYRIVYSNQATFTKEEIRPLVATYEWDTD